MTPDRTVAHKAVAFASFTLVLLTLLAAVPAAHAAPGAPPYCVKMPGSLGPDSGPVICRFVDYQLCLQAAADWRGNCVANIDYRGPAPAPSRRRGRMSQD